MYLKQQKSDPSINPDQVPIYFIRIMPIYLLTNQILALSYKLKFRQKYGKEVWVSKWDTYKCFTSVLTSKKAKHSWRSKIDSNGFFKQCGFLRLLKEKSFQSETARTLYLEKDCQRPVKISLQLFSQTFFLFQFHSFSIS